MPFSHAAVVAEIDAVLQEWTNWHTRGNDDTNKPEAIRVAGLLASAIERLAPPGSAYRKSTQLVVERFAASSPGYGAKQLPGTLQALRADYAADRLRAVEELIHADTFSDFLEMAKYLLDENYKDPAAVIAGSTLEGHLRALCAKHGVPTSTAAGPKKANLINDELAKVPAYAQGDAKSVRAWLDLRNDAAHGDYNKYQAGQVGLLIDGVRDFIRRVPA
jgi:hypothetical protein